MNTIDPRKGANRVTLRQAIQEDSDFAYSVKKAAFRGYVEQVWGWDENEQLQMHQERYDVQEFRIITTNGLDVGVMALAIDSCCLHLNQLFILPEHQGKGIGEECMAIMLKQAQQLSLPVHLAVLKANPRALRFYKRLGFAVADETDTHFLLEKALRDR